jgi:hypothetical protein
MEWGDYTPRMEEENGSRSGWAKKRASKILVTVDDLFPLHKKPPTLKNSPAACNASSTFDD